MKFIGLGHSHNLDIADAVYYHIVDSALVNNGKPFFIPNFAKRFEGRLCLAVRISRLGRSISERFAYRYFDGVAITCRFEAKDLHEELISQNMPSDMAISFDGAVNISHCIMLDDIDTSMLDASLFVDGELIQQIKEDDFIRCVSKMISSYSRYSTLRQGDYFLIDTPDAAFMACENQHIDGYINSEHLLSFNIK